MSDKVSHEATLVADKAKELAECWIVYDHARGGARVLDVHPGLLLPGQTFVHYVAKSKADAESASRSTGLSAGQTLGLVVAQTKVLDLHQECGDHYCEFHSGKEEEFSHECSTCNSIDRLRAAKAELGELLLTLPASASRPVAQCEHDGCAEPASKSLCREHLLEFAYGPDVSRSTVGSRDGVSGVLRWPGGAESTLCLVPRHQVEAPNGPRAATAEDLAEFGWVPARAASAEDKLTALRLELRQTTDAWDTLSGQMSTAFELPTMAKGEAYARVVSVLRGILDHNKTLAGSPGGGKENTDPVPGHPSWFETVSRAEHEATTSLLRDERDRARAELGEICVAATVRPGEEWHGRPSASCDAVASILAERDMLDAKLAAAKMKLTEQQAEHERVLADYNGRVATLRRLRNEAQTERDALKLALEKLTKPTTLAALKLAQKALCSYIGDTCDCKYGANGRGEQTGCPEMRSLIDAIEAHSASSAGSGDIEAEAADTAAESKPWQGPDWKPRVGDRVEHYDRRRGVITATPNRLLRNSCGNADVLFDGERGQEVWLSSIRPEQARQTTAELSGDAPAAVQRTLLGAYPLISSGPDHPASTAEVHVQPAQPATGGTERCDSRRYAPLGARCTKPKGHTGKHWEGDPQNEPPWNVAGNWSDDTDPSPALPVGQEEDRPPGGREIRVFLSGDGESLAFPGGNFTTVRACRHCGALITGGPTACVHCVEADERPALTVERMVSVLQKLAIRPGCGDWYGNVADELERKAGK